MKGQVIIISTILILCPPLTGCKDKREREPQKQENKVTLTKLHMRLLGIAVTDFMRDVGRYPTQEEGLTALVQSPGDVHYWQPGGYLETVDVPRDEWGNDFIYEQPADNPTSFVIKSLGADGRAGGEGCDADLVIVWRSGRPYGDF